MALTICRDSGIAAGAWAVLIWTRMLLDTPLPPHVLPMLAPRRALARYLVGWLGRDPGGLYTRRPDLVRFGFSLALQDTPADVARALGRFLVARHAAAVPT